jgi:hypothetical protein
MTTHTLTTNWIKPPLSQNDRLHWAERARKVRDAKQHVHYLAMQAGLPKGVAFADIVLAWYPGVNRSRDVDNPQPSLKAAVDGLRDFGLVADDDSSHVKSSCEVREVVGVGNARVLIEITVADEVGEVA